MPRLVSTILLAVLVVVAAHGQEAPTVTFKSGVEQVAVSAIVRDSRGKLVTSLKPSDFEVFDAGHPRKLTNVWSEPSPASVAILMDASGSMATKMERARQTADLIVSGLKPGSDEVAFYSFDTTLTEVRPFSTTFTVNDGAWSGTRAFGATSLWDAIAETAGRISDRQRRRVLIVITDGVDSASRMTPTDVSTVASELDVPVYTVVVALAAGIDDRDERPLEGPLANLASWTGGDSMTVRDITSAVTASQRILAELHHQYMLAFEPGTAPGWHPLVVRAKKPGLFVRARSGYVVK